MCKNVYDFLLTLEPLSPDHISAITAMLEHDSLDGFKWISEGHTSVDEFIKRVLFRDHIRNGFYWALRFGNSIVGFAGFRYNQESGKYLTKSYVTPVARGMGIANNVTKCLVVLANNLDIEIYSRVALANKRSNSRMSNLIGDSIASDGKGNVFYLLDDVADKEMTKYSPVIFALSERMQNDLRMFSFDHN